MGPDRPYNVNAPAPRIGGLSLEQRQQRQAQDSTSSSFDALGTLVRPDELRGITDIVSRMSRPGGANVGRITLGEGIYYVRSTWEFRYPGVELFGTPGQTVIQRAADFDGPLLLFHEAECAVEGIRFVDTVATKGTQPCIKFADNAAYGRVLKCTFAACSRAVELDAPWQLVAENLVLSYSDIYGIHLTNVADFCAVQCNRILPNARGVDIYSDNTSARNAFTGNVLGSATGLSYKGGLGNIGSGLNSGTVIVR